LIDADANGLTSLAFPAIGTGNLKHPHDVIATIMYDEVAKFSKGKPLTTLKNISFVIYNKDQPGLEVSHCLCFVFSHLFLSP